MSKIKGFFKGSSSSGSGSKSSSGSSSSKSKHHRSRGGPTPQEALHKLRETEEMLTKKQDYLENKIQQEIAIAKKNGTKNKRGMFLFLFLFFGLISERIDMYFEKLEAHTDLRD